MDQVDGKNRKSIERKQQLIMNKWIPEARTQQKFKDPAKG